MSKITVCTAIAALLLLGVAQAENRVLSWDDGHAVSMEVQKTLGHCIRFEKQPDWDKTFSKGLQVYAQRYGDVGSHQVSLVVFGPQGEGTPQQEDYPDGLVIHGTTQVKMAEFPEQPGWVTLPMDPIDLPDEFWVAVFTRSKEDFGVRLGRTAGDNRPSWSSSTKPGNPEMQDIALFTPWSEGGNWMIRLEVAPTPEEHVPLNSTDINGQNFTVFDDGSVDDYYSFQKGGPYLQIKNNYSKKVSRVYFYGYVAGDWYNTDRKAGVYLLDDRRRIIARTQLPFNNFTGEPAWSFVNFEGAAVPATFYVLIEPFNRPGIELLLGYDNSSENQGSDFGTVGVLYDWNLSIPKDSTNWMIRVEYQ